MLGVVEAVIFSMTVKSHNGADCVLGIDIELAGLRKTQQQDALVPLHGSVALQVKEGEHQRLVPVVVKI